MKINTNDYNLCKWFLSAYIFIIFISSPYLPLINSYVSSKIRNLSTIYTLATIVAFLAFFFFYFYKGISDKQRFLIWGVPVLLFSGFLIYMIPLPIERIHFLEYFILSMLVFKYLYPRDKYPSIFIKSVSVTFLVGVTDELWQGFLPNRYFGYMDIAVNGISGIIGQLFIYGIIQPDLHES